MKKPSKLLFVLSTTDIKKMRYKSADDWFDPDVTKDDVTFATLTADHGKDDYNFLVLMHALVEQYLCYKHGIKDKEVTKFDMDNPDLDDPGNDPKAPYHNEHLIANDIEAMLSAALDVKWVDYEAAIEKTLKKFPKKK